MGKQACCWQGYELDTADCPLAPQLKVGRFVSSLVSECNVERAFLGEIAGLSELQADESNNGSAACLKTTPLQMDAD